MKLVLVTTLLTFISNSSYALAGDQDVTVFSCESAEPYPDKVIKLKIIEGGYSGLTRLILEESLVWGSRNTSYVVHLQSKASRDSVLTYKGQGASLKIYLNDLDEQGRYSAFFSRKFSKKNQLEALKCLDGR